ncbi:hypothetical protein M9Y10_028316 [Tritrichomonas musculus]|uniref:Myb-like DNA-binding domain containing protein n=1 Tax=Tritrichomonas musculus TaxID=1915356 RepID=A0ABR2KK20_9EUKA
MMFVPNQYYYTYNTANPYTQFAPINMPITEAPQRTRFTKAEDELLKQLVNSQEQPNWNEIAIHMKHRTARQCRERYNNYLRPNLINGPWTPEEDELLIDLYDKYGPKWALISQSFNSRSPVNIKNHHSSLVSQSVVKSRKNHLIENNHENIKSEEKIANNEFRFTENIDPLNENSLNEDPINANSINADPLTVDPISVDPLNIDPINVEPTNTVPANEQKVEQKGEGASNDQTFDNMFPNVPFGEDDLWSNTLVQTNDSDLLAF